MDQLIQALGTALDAVEAELLGASTNHGKRIAVLCSLMGRRSGMSEETVRALTACALLHDNALSEYIAEEIDSQIPSFNLHCTAGQRNVDTLDLGAESSDFVLYHHERADGNGAFHKKAAEETSLGSQFISITDSLDVHYHLQRVPLQSLEDIRLYIRDKADSHYTRRSAEVLLDVLDSPVIESLSDQYIHETAARVLPPWSVDIEQHVLLDLAAFVSRIIDCKSVFTRKHSVQIAEKAWKMGEYYRYDPSTRIQLYLAASMHDLGKLFIPTAILEKTSRLNDEEFRIIQQHIYKTWELLGTIEGFETIHRWASQHHERLNGTGYPFAKKASELDFNARLLACIDIYQAVSEERPYHKSRSHYETMPILYDLVQTGAIDRGIVRDMDIVFAPAKY
jgi:HD-GYP domain-containing protein (c-di-GMP phosphodiesterase class II)